MKYIIIIVIFSILFSCKLISQSSVKSSTDSIGKEFIEKFIIGDINKDGVIDTAYVITPPLKFFVDRSNPKVNFAFDLASDTSHTEIKFSCKIPPIRYKKSIYGIIENVGFLSGGDVCELIFIPGWFQGCWSSIHLFQFKNNKWHDVSNATINNCDLETFKSRIITKKKNYYILGQKFNPENASVKDYKVKIKFK